MTSPNFPKATIFFCPAGPNGSVGGSCSSSHQLRPVPLGAGGKGLDEGRLRLGQLEVKQQKQFDLDIRIFYLHYSSIKY